VVLLENILSEVVWAKEKTEKPLTACRKKGEIR